MVQLTCYANDRVLPLIVRTAELAQGDFPMEHSMWARLEAMSRVDADTNISSRPDL